MHRVKRSFSIAAPALVALAILPALQVRAADNPAEWAPKDSLIYLGVRNCDDLVASVKKTGTWRMTDDPAVQGAVQPWKNVAKKLRDLFARKLNIENPKDLEVYPHGALALFIVSSGGTGEEGTVEEHVAVTMDMGEDLEKAQNLARAVVQKCLEKGARKETKEAVGSEITLVQFPKEQAEGEAAGVDTDPLVEEIITLLESEDVGLDPIALGGIREGLMEMEPPDEFAFTFQEKRLILGSGEEPVRAALKVLRDGSDNSFARNPAMRTLKEHCDFDAPVHIVFNVPAMVEIAGREDQDAQKQMRAVGMYGLGPLVMTGAYVPEPGVESRLKGFLEVGKERKGIGRMLMMSNSRTAPPSTVSADVAVFGSINIDPPVILEEVIEIVSRIDPAEGEEMRAGMKAPQPDGSVLDIQKDVVNHLSGPLFGFLTMSAPYAAEDFNAMIALGHKSRAAMDKLIAMIPPGMLIPREMMGAMIFEPGFAPVGGIAMALTDRTLIPIGTKSAVESYIRSEGRSGGGLADDPQFKRLMRHVPQESCAMVYADNRKVYEAQLALAKSGAGMQPPQMGEPAGAYLQMMLMQNYMGKELKDPEALRKYQTLGVVTLTSESDGLRFDAVTTIAGQMD